MQLLRLSHDAPTQFRWPVQDKAAIVLTPALNGWEVPAWTFFGDMEHSRCPPQVHVAVGHWLHDGYGAELVGLADRTLEFLPGRRPQSEREALCLAADLRGYAHAICTADINAGVAEIASSLMNSSVWTFGWE